MLYSFYDYKCKCKNCGDEFVLEKEHKPPCTIPVESMNISECTTNGPRNYCTRCFEFAKGKPFYIPSNKYSLCDKCRVEILPQLIAPEYATVEIYPFIKAEKEFADIATNAYDDEMTEYLERLEKLYKRNRERLKQYEFCESDEFEKTPSRALTSDTRIKKLSMRLADYIEDEASKCEKLHKILEKGQIFDFNFNKNDICEKGIYIFYEKSEKGHDGDRIVRIGIVKEKLLSERLYTHYFKNKNKSIFRKNIGRTFLCNNQQMLDDWNKRGTNNVDIEKKVSAYFIENFYFKVIEINDLEKRLELESKLIGTVSNCRNCRPSQSWFGNKSPVCKIKKSGLWQEQHLDGKELSENDLSEIEIYLIKN